MLKINHLSKKFGNKKILDDVSLTINKGHIAVLLGQSGVGKSTLLRILSNLEKADSGDITLNGIPLDPVTIFKKNLVGMVFQQFNLFDHMTVQENITFPLIKVAKKTLEAAQDIAQGLLERYSLADKKDHYPSQLSGGQKQRLAIARALALKPEIICMDEPTSALDPLLTTYVATSIGQLAQEGYFVLVASHDTLLLEKLECTIHLMHEGKIIESAHSKDFYANKDNYPRIKQFVAGTL